MAPPTSTAVYAPESGQVGAAGGLPATVVSESSPCSPHGASGSSPSSPSSRLFRRGSYQQPSPRRRHQQISSLSPARKGGSFRFPPRRRRPDEPEFDVHENDRFLPVPPVNIKLEQTADPDEAEESDKSGMEGDMEASSRNRRRRHRPPKLGNSLPHGEEEGADSPSDYSPCYSPGNSPWNPVAPLPPNMWPSCPPPEVQLPPPEVYDHRRRSSTMHHFDPPSFQHPQQQSQGLQQQQQPIMHRDQFDEFVYKSQHIASAQMSTVMIPNPPEVNIEVPSDSDSSRRPSKASFGNTSGISNASSYSSFPLDVDRDRRSPTLVNGHVGAAGARLEGMQAAAASGTVAGGAGVASLSPNGSRSGSRRASVCVGIAEKTMKSPSRHAATNSLLAARPVLDRRSSHTGVLMTRSSCYPGRIAASNSTSPRRDSSNMLGVPRRRSRGASLPGSMELNTEDIYRLRNFSLSGRKVINRGDSLKARSNHSINSTGSSIELRNSNYSSSLTNSDQDFSNCSGNSSRRASRASRRPSYQPAMAGAMGGQPEMTPAIEVVHGPPPEQYRVAMLGASGVGKSALTSQFLSSDHMNTYDNVEDDVQKIVSLSVDGKESQLVFIDHAHTDMSVENQISTYDPHGYMVVYAVDEEESMEQAERILNYLKGAAILQQNAVILVANKTDLVRSRVVSSATGKALAIKYGVKYIETSPGINHNVDELLVGMLAQIQLRIEANSSAAGAAGTSSGNKASSKVGMKVMDLLERVMKIQNNKSKSCGNLHVL